MEKTLESTVGRMDEAKIDKSYRREGTYVAIKGPAPFALQFTQMPYALSPQYLGTETGTTSPISGDTQKDD